MITIRDLAKQAGVSVATVSRVFNNYPDVSEATKEKVLALARELDFRPSAAARTLKTQRSKVIGVFFNSLMDADLMHPFFQEVIVGFKRAIGAAGYDMLLFTNMPPGDGDSAFVRLARHHRVDGVVVMGVDPTAPYLRRLISSGIPCMAVDIDAVGQRAGYVISDNRTGADLAVRHLHERGHRRIAIITGMLNSRPGHDRLVGYREALEGLGVAYRSEYVQDGDYSRDSGYEAANRLLQLPERPTAIFSCGDYMAIGALRAAHEQGLRVPEDVALVGFDDIQVAAMIHPSLTTVWQDKVGLGMTAGQGLVAMIEDPDCSPPVITLPVRLIVRESSDS